MLHHEPKLNRAESSRINGAKSRGAKTPEGMFRSQTARYKHGLYSTRGFMLPGESVEEFTELKDQLIGYWQPTGFYEQTIVHQMAGNLWETFRLQAAKNDHIHDVRAGIALSLPKLRDNAKLNLMAENKATTDGGTIERNNARMNFLTRQRDQMERSLLRLERRGGDQWINPKLVDNKRQTASGHTRNPGRRTPGRHHFGGSLRRQRHQRAPPGDLQPAGRRAAPTTERAEAERGANPTSSTGPKPPSTSNPTTSKRKS